MIVDIGNERILKRMCDRKKYLPQWIDCNNSCSKGNLTWRLYEDFVLWV